MSGQAATFQDLGTILGFATKAKEKAENMQESLQQFLQNPEIREIEKTFGKDCSDYITRCSDRDNIITMYRETRKRILFNKENSDSIEAKLSYFGVPIRFKSARQEQISPSVWKTVYPIDDGLFLFGNTGTGKTHLSVAILKSTIEQMKPVIHFDWQCHRWRIERPLSPEFVSIPDLLLEIRDTFSPSSVMTEAQIIKRYTNNRLIVFDDLGAEKTTDWSLQTLYTIIDRRYRNKFPTVITSNLSLDDISTEISDRIASRIAGMCKVIELEGNDRRIQ